MMFLTGDRSKVSVQVLTVLKILMLLSAVLKILMLLSAVLRAPAGVSTAV